MFAKNGSKVALLSVPPVIPTIDVERTCFWFFMTVYVWWKFIHLSHLLVYMFDTFGCHRIVFPQNAGTKTCTAKKIAHPKVNKIVGPVKWTDSQVLVHFCVGFARKFWSENGGPTRAREPNQKKCSDNGWISWRKFWCPTVKFYLAPSKMTFANRRQLDKTWQNKNI